MNEIVAKNRVLHGEVIDQQGRPIVPEGLALGVTDDHRYEPAKVWADMIDRIYRVKR